MCKVKRLLSVMVAVFVFVGMLAGCGSTKTTSDDKDSKPKIAVVLKSLDNPYWQIMKESIIEYSKEKGFDVDVFAPKTSDDLQGQLEIIESALAKDYDGIGISPLTGVNAISGVVKATKDGIPVVDIDEKFDMNELEKAGGKIVGYVTSDNKAIGKLGAEFIIEKLGSAGGNVAIIEGKSGGDANEDRKAGAKEAFEKTENVKVVAVQPADWDRVKALDVATNILQSNPDIKAFYCCNDNMALGARTAVENAGKENDIIIVGTDGVPEALDSVKAGKLNATVAQDPTGIGNKCMDILLEAIKNKGTDTEPVYTTVDAKVVSE